MPILDAEPDLHPTDLFERRQDERQWVVAHTRPRQEKALARDLLASGVPFYLPCDRRRVKVRSKIVTSRPVVFAGYVFAREAEGERNPIRFNARVASVLTVKDQEQLWADLRRIQQILDLGAPVTPELTLVPGTLVTVRDGPLTGMTGTVVKAAGGFKFVVRVDFIRQGLSVLVDGQSLGLTQSDESPSNAQRGTQPC